MFNFIPSLLPSVQAVRRIFSMAKPQVIFVLGGPGAGKGTQCAKIVEKFGYVHLSAGDLLRKEKNTPDSKVGQLIANYIKEGKIVPVKITCGLLEKAMNETMEETNGEKYKFLIDGFPRNKDNLDGWNDAMNDKVDLKFVLFFDCPESVCTTRILERGQTSGRTDDNADSLKKRFNTYATETKPIIDHYGESGKVRKIAADHDPETVFQETSKYFQ
ncbi:UMP-CMP kinase-like [Styela clava]